MTGPEHYRMAEDCMGALEEGEDNTEWLLCAQVHATLALAAATALRGEHGQPANDWDEWRKTAAVKP